MSTFTLEDSGGLAAGQGIGDAIKAFAMAGGARQKAELDAGMRSAQMFHNNMAGAKAGNEAALLAEKLGLVRDPMKAAMLENGVPLDKRGAMDSYVNTGGFGPSYDAPADGMGPTQPAPIDPSKANLVRQALALAMKANMTGSNVQQMANARDIGTKTDTRQSILDGSVDPTRAAQARFGVDGGPAVFDNVGNTGSNINNATGAITEQNPVLAKIFADAEAAKNSQRAAAAGASNARAANTREKTAGLGGEHAEKDKALTSSIIKTLQVPKIDEKGKKVINPLTGAVDTETDQAALKSYYTWLDSTKQKVGANTFAKWEANGRPTGGASSAPGENKSPAAAGTTPKIALPKGMSADDALAQAKAAIARGKDRDAVIKRLTDMGVDTKGL